MNVNSKAFRTTAWIPRPIMVRGKGLINVSSENIMTAINKCIHDANAMTSDEVKTCLEADKALNIYAQQWEMAKRDLIFREDRSSRYFRLNSTINKDNLMKLYADFFCTEACPNNLSYSLGEFGGVYVPPTPPIPPEPPEPPEPPIPPKPEPTIISTRGLVVGFGDSYMDASDDRSYPASMTESLQQLNSAGLIGAYNRYAEHGLHAVDAGKSGDTAQDMLARIAAVKALNPTLVVIRVGTNDISRSVPVSTYESNLDSIVKQLSPTKVIVTPQNKFSATPQATIDSFNQAIERVIESNENAFACELVNFIDDKSMLGADGVHPTAYGSYMYGKDIYNAVHDVIRSTWKPEQELVAPFGEYVAVDPATTSGANGNIPSGWSASGKAQHSKVGSSSWHRIACQSTERENVSLSSPSWTNNTGVPIKVMARCKFRASNLSGLDSTTDFNISSKVNLSIFNTSTWSSFTYDAIGNWNKANGDKVPEAVFETGVLEVPNGETCAAIIYCNAGTDGIAQGNKPIIEFSDVELIPVDGKLPDPPEPPVVENLIVNGKFEGGTIAPWSLIGVDQGNTATPLGDGFVKIHAFTTWWGGITQKVDVTEAGNYSLRFTSRNMNLTPNHEFTITVRKTGTEGAGDIAKWVNANGEWVATGALTAGSFDILIANQNNSDNEFEVGNISLTKDV